MKCACRGPASGWRRGFTLVELVVVIAIILVLVGLTIAVGVTVIRGSETRETENTMRLLDAAYEEWRVQSQRQLTFGLQNEPCNQGEIYEIGQIVGASPGWANEAAAVADALIITDLIVARLAQSEIFESSIASIAPRNIKRLDVDDDSLDEDLSHLESAGFRVSYRFLDAWEEPILAIHAGRQFNGTCGDDSYAPGGPDEDGTIRTPYENHFGVASNRRLFFVSSGPSARFGNLRLNIAHGSLTETQRTEAERAFDNVYSYPVNIENARPGS